MSTSENLRKLKQDIQASLSVNRRVDEWRKHETNESKLVNIINRSKNADILNNDITYTGGSLSSKESLSYTAPTSCNNDPTNVWTDPTPENTFYSLFACDSSNKPPYGQNLCLDRTEVCALWESGWGYYDIGLNGGVQEKFNGLLVPSFEKYMSLCASGDTNCQREKTKLHFDHKKLYNEAWQLQLVNCMHTPTEEVNLPPQEKGITDIGFDSTPLNLVVGKKKTEINEVILDANSLKEAKDCYRNVLMNMSSIKHYYTLQRKYFITKSIPLIYDYYTTVAECVYDTHNPSGLISSETEWSEAVYNNQSDVQFLKRACTWEDRKLSIYRAIKLLNKKLDNKILNLTHYVISNGKVSCNLPENVRLEFDIDEITSTSAE